MYILRAALGILFFLVVAWLLSSHRRRINWRVIVGGLLLQVVLAFLILETEPGRVALDGLAQGVSKFLEFSVKGSEFVFGPLAGFHQNPVEPADASPEALSWYDEYPFALIAEGRSREVGVIFAFRALPTIIFFSAVMAILYHLGIMQVIIWLMARVMTWSMRVSGAEALAMAANVFVGQTEAPLVIRPYLPTMTRSELMALMTGGFATIAGSVLAVYIGFLGKDFAGHLLAASFMSAPAAFMIAKIMVPETEQPLTEGQVELKIERPASNVLDAAAMGTADGLKLYLNVLAMLIAFVAIIHLINWPLSSITVGTDAMGNAIPLSLEWTFGRIFSPVAWMMGVEWADCQQFGSLLGTKLAVNEFVAFGRLGTDISDHTMSPRSLRMAAYALCGFANFASIGIQIGGISPLAPKRRSTLSRLALRAMIGGAFASWMTATIAGAFVHD